MVEVFTVGGGEYIVNTFNAVAAWTGGGGYKSLIKVVLVIGLIYSLLAVAFSMNFRAWMNWFLGATMIYLCLMVPTVDVRVTDRVNPDLVPATVANVPLGLGVMASFTSQVGDYLTRTAETVFVMPSQLNYSTNGMIYGSRLFDATRNFQIRDAEFATNLQAHFKQCAFGDIMLHRKSLTDLTTSQDLWADIGPGSPARSQQWLERDGGVESSIVTCQQAYDMLTARWEPIIEMHAPIWAKETYPRLTNALASRKLRQEVPIANTAFTNAATDFTGTMRQNTAINAFMQARDAMAGGSGAAAIDTFATTRADIQARNTYNSIAQQAMSWVPILNVVLTVVFYAMFPVIFPLFLMPQTGIQALKGYVTGFFYLASWGPLYVILHMICMSRGESAARGIADGGVALASYAGIGAVNAETATIAGFMLMSVPFIAGGLARGALSVSSQATSILAPAQNAAEASALEQTTGNYAYGNVSYANSSANMHQSNQYSDAPTVMTGQATFTYRGSNGSSFTTMANGQQIIDASPSISKLPFTVQTNDNVLREDSRALNYLERRSESLENAASHVRTISQSERFGSSTTTEKTTGSELRDGSQTGAGTDRSIRNTASTSTGIDQRDTVVHNSRIGNSEVIGAETFDQTQATLSGGIGGRGPAGAGGGKGGKSLLDRLPSATVSKTLSGQQTNRLGRTTENVRSIDSSSSATNSSRDEQSYSDMANVTESMFSSDAAFARSSITAASFSSREHASQVADSLEARAREAKENVHQLSEDIRYARNNGMMISENLNEEFKEWYREAASRLPSSVQAPPPGLHETNLDPARRQVRDGLIGQFFEERRKAIYESVGGRLHLPENSDLREPRVNTPEELSALHSPPPATAQAQNGPAQSDGSAITARVAAGKQQVEATQGAAKIMRAGSVAAGADLQGEVDKNLAKSFFTDPILRR